jgi:hypothetical protein
MNTTTSNGQNINLKGVISIRPNQMDNAVLKRLIKEIDFEKKENGSNKINAYNRTHNRHNRGR